MLLRCIDSAYIEGCGMSENCHLNLSHLYLINDLFGDARYICIELIEGQLEVVDVEALSEGVLIQPLALLQVGDEEVGDPRQVPHPLLPPPLLLLPNPLILGHSFKHECKPLPQAGQQSVLHLQHDVIASPPLAGVQQVEGGKNCFQLEPMSRLASSQVAPHLPYVGRKRGCKPSSS